MVTLLRSLLSKILAIHIIIMYNIHAIVDQSNNRVIDNMNFSHMHTRLKFVRMAPMDHRQQAHDNQEKQA